MIGQTMHTEKLAVCHSSSGAVAVHTVAICPPGRTGAGAAKPSQDLAADRGARRYYTYVVWIACIMSAAPRAPLVQRDTLFCLVILDLVLDLHVLYRGRWLDLYLGRFLARNGHLCYAMA